MAAGFIDAGEGRYRIEQSGWASLYWVRAGKITVTLTENRSPIEIASGGCLGIPSGREHVLNIGATSASDGIRHRGIPSLTPKSSGKPNEIFLIRVSNASHVLPGILPLAIPIPANEASSVPGLLPTLNSLADIAGEIDIMHTLLKCRMADTLAVSLVAHVARKINAPITEVFGGGFDNRIRKAIAAVHENPSHAWTLERLARHANLSRASFARRFRSSMSESPLAYVRRIRINLAASYLQVMDWPISVIAYEVGYQSEAAFINAFKRQMQTSPGRFRKRALAASVWGDVRAEK